MGGATRAIPTALATAALGIGTILTVATQEVNGAV